MNAFAESVRSRRVKLRMTLRDFCRACELDPSNWSKVERSLASPPKEPSVLQRIAKALGYDKNSAESMNLADLSAISQGMIPHTIMKDAQLVAKLPMFFRSVRGDKHTHGELRSLAEIIRDSETPE